MVYELLPMNVLSVNERCLYGAVTFCIAFVVEMMLN